MLSEEGDCDQYWSAIEPVLVAKPPEYGFCGGGCTSIYYLYGDERIRISALAEGTLPFLIS